MNGLFYAHSGLRYLVLLLALANLVVLALGAAKKAEAGKLHRVLGSAFVGLLDVQLVLGVVMVALGRFYPQLIGHLVMMVLAVAVTHGLFVMAKRRPERALPLRLLAVGLALLLIVGGVMAIGRPLLGTTAPAPMP
ncbi:MAG: hypothetical protein AMXMBFR34_54490 [Myxococcaceae bacterium]